MLPVGIEARILSQEDIENGVNVNFPTSHGISIPVESKVPSSTISKQSFLTITGSTTYITLLITEMYPGPVTNTFLANSFLPSNFDGYSYIGIVYINMNLTEIFLGLESIISQLP